MQDSKEARRKDRHLDAGLDDSFDSYNEMLARLAERTGKDAQ
jgi:putative copper resistance protein D